MTYKEKLEDPLWIAKRHWIIKLDNFHCRHCNSPAFTEIFRAKYIVRGTEKILLPEYSYLNFEEFLKLNVHHKHYRQGSEPWEYEDDALITLCPECHKKEHETKKIPVYSSRGGLLDYCEICERCGVSVTSPNIAM